MNARINFGFVGFSDLHSSREVRRRQEKTATKSNARTVGFLIFDEEASVLLCCNHCDVLFLIYALYKRFRPMSWGNCMFWALKTGRRITSGNFAACHDM